LRVQTGNLVNRPLESSDSLLDEVISFYKLHPDNEKMTDAYYYKAVNAYKMRDYQRSIIFFKKAEILAEHSGNLRHKFKVAEGISFVNGRCANYDFQLKYAKQALDLAKRVNNKNWIAYSYYRMGVAHSKFGNEDSISYYLHQMEKYTKFINEKELPLILANLGLLYRDSNPEEAKKFLMKSLSYKEFTNTYEWLAEIAYDEGKPDEAYHYWKRALTIQDATPKDNVIHNLIEYDIERGKTDSICERINEIIAIRDSIDAKLKNDTIKDLQTRFDHEVAMREKDQTIIRWQWGILAAILVIVGLAAYSIIKRYRSGMVLKNYQMQIIDYTNQIREMELASEDYSKQIETLSQEVRQIMDEKSPRLSEGRMLYDCIMESKPIVKWSADDERKFIEYYTATNYRTVDRLRKEPRKEKLTDHKLLYLLLKEMGKTDNEVCDIMGLSDAGLRSIRNRTKPLKEPAG
jgi:tetratricopeptide (TPR) repeat protein